MITFLTAVFALLLQDKPLTAEQQKAQLDSRHAWLDPLKPTFGKFCEHAYTFADVNIISEVPKIGKVEVINPFPESYKPTWREMFDTLARQTQTSWSYSDKDTAWVFAKPALATPFKFDLAKEWKQEDRGLYVFCKPPDAPVGMDIYQLGSYSFEKDADKEMLKIRDEIALRFLSRINPDIKVDDMKKVTIDGAEAVHVETPAPKEGVTWRQWVFVKDGRAYAIVSALDNDKEALVKDVKATVVGFKFVKEAKK